MKNINLKNKSLIWLASGTAALGLGLGVAGMASAATSTTATGAAAVAQAPSQIQGLAFQANSGTNNSAAPAQNQAMPDPSTLANGPGETPLTGDTLAKVEAAVKTAEPGASIIRAETDSGGHAYEAHIKLADGTTKTLYFTSDYKADGSDTGFGAPPAGQKGLPPMGQPGQAPAQQSSSSTQASN
jgi:hypothetical protein